MTRRGLLGLLLGALGVRALHDSPLTYKGVPFVADAGFDYDRWRARNAHRFTRYSACTSDPRDPSHCWHWRAGKGIVEKDGSFSGEVWCCHCARIGLRRPHLEHLVSGHSMLTIDNGNANDAEFVT